MYASGGESIRETVVSMVCDLISPHVQQYLLLSPQVEFADVILLNKVDLATPADLTRLHSMLKALNPTARLLETTRCEVDLTEVLNSQRFSIDRASEAAGWQQVCRVIQCLKHLNCTT